MNIKSFLPSAVGVLAVLVVAAMARDRLHQGSHLASLDDTWTQAASELNRHAPMMVDLQTRFDSATVGGGDFIYNYTLVNYPAYNVDQKFLDRIRPRLVEKACASPCTNEAQLTLISARKVVGAIWSRSWARFFIVVGTLSIMVPTAPMLHLVDRGNVRNLGHEP